MQKKKFLFSFIFISSLFVSFSTTDQLSFISKGIYAQSQINNLSPSIKFLNYYNPSIMMKIKYPSFWQKPVVINNDTISFSSPVKTIGVIFQIKSVPNMSNDEISMRMISDIKNNFSNVRILNMNETILKDGSLIQKLQFTYGNLPDEFKELELIKAIDGRAYIFIYYADSSLFNQFFPIASVMSNSLQTPIFTNTFSQLPLSATISNNQLTKNIKNTTIPNNKPIIKNQNNSSYNSKNILLYANKSLGIRIQYPSYLKEIAKDRGIYLTSNNKSIGIIFVNMPLKNISQNDFISEHILSLNNSLTNFNITNSSTSDILGYPTQMILFTYSNGGQLYKGLQIWKVAIDHAYIFTYYAQSDKLFNNFLPTVMDMVDSIQISK